jgi:cation diffusion facilitator family transporter
MEYHSLAEREKRSVALSSIAGAVVITSLKLVVGLSTASLGILSEAMHSGLDLIAAIITFFAIRFSAVPADTSHTYGHGKIENFSALIETLLLLVTCFWIISEAIDRLLHHSREIEVNFWSFFVIVASIAVDYSRSKALMKAARKHRSQALEADALHFRTDIWSSSVVLVGLMLTLLSFTVADSVAAIVVALIVVYVSISLGKRTIDDLLDRAPAGVERRILEVVRGVEGVRDVEQIRVRNSGPRMFVNLRIGIRRMTPFQLADGLVHRVEAALHAAIPDADILIHPEPVETADETMAEKIKLMMSEEGLIAHDVQVFKVNGKSQVEFQLEFDQEDFLRVHEAVTKIENRIKAALPDIGLVVIHIEDSREKVVESVDITRGSEALISRVRDVVMGAPHVHGCTILSVLDAGGKFYLSMNIQVDKDLTLEEVHEVSTSVENRIMVELPEIKSVQIHPEPSEWPPRNPRKQ